jgi:hypothetical protein
MKKILLACSIFLLGNQIINAQTLSAGDIAIIGVNEDAGPVAGEDHSFTWIALKAIPAGEIIYFTDQGVNINSMTWFGNTENHYSWTAPSGGISCGTIVHVYEDGSTNNLVAIGGGTMSGILFGSGWNLSSGDQVLAYQATGARSAIGSTTFIAGIHLNDDLSDGESNGWTTTTYNSTGVARCHLPPGLTDGVNCISLHSPTSPENDNNKYIGTLTGTAATLRALINSPFPSGNWSGDNGSTATVSISVGAYSPSVTCPAPCTNPNIPSPTVSTNNICPSTSVTLSWTGSLNDATLWHIYTSSCGVTQLATTVSNSLVVSPSVTTTYYIRGEDGAGCVDESTGLCGSYTVIVDKTASSITSATASTNNVCASTLVDVTANGVTAGSGATLTWYTGAGGTGSNLGGSNPLSVSPATTTTYYARLAGTCNTVETSITVIVLPAIDTSTTTNGFDITSNQTGATYQWINCNNGNTIIAGETNATYTATANGDYAVIVTMGSCSDTSVCVNINVLSINESSFGKNIQLSPNPTNGNVTISNIEPSITTIRIFDVTGKKVYSLSNINKSEVQISLTDFGKGIYFVKLTGNQQQKVIKLINR